MMNFRKITERILGISFVYMAYYMLFSFLNGAFTGSILNCIFMLTNYFIYIGAYFLGIKIKNIFLYIAGLILLFLPCLYLKNATFLYKIMTFLILAYSFSKRLNPDKNVSIGLESMAALLMLNFGMYIIAPLSNIEFMRIFILAESLAIIIISIIYTHFKGINLELELTATMGTQPVRDIVDFNNKVLLCYILAVLIVIYLGISGNTRYIVLYIYNAIIAFIRYIISLSNYKDKPSHIVPTDIQRDNFGVDISDAPKWAMILEQIFIYVAGTIFIIALLAGIFITLLNIYKRFKRNRDNIDCSEFILASVKAEKIQKKKTSYFSIKDKIRRKFYITVKKYYKTCGIKISDTPDEIHEKIKTYKNISQLILEYENVRYGRPKS